ncbi:MAG: formate dehydrogenase accessory sulfurtransferase FdhD [Caldilineaceae bacterium]|nr:formate dehydrogenase accessory sulfurtransferase FdhD [Caldilineaceae bacterium]MBP8108013.1 formate dehydrogenase accessory sulfurtransferase FdhD [Caldilineaceae bacterium]MBP8125193.1 formate dehydrogenase accessory sulfurtransferase FdhD [Caldilineaceae bacterium]MBP9071010.1 formate dehydrogenase accessory sulfurtransferase FdhD [Caldilineaceae bacterium]
MTSGTQPTVYQLKQGEHWQTVAAHVIEEATVCLHVNGQELAAFMCTPLNLEALALGFLRAESIIAGLEEVALVDLIHGGTCIDVWLTHEVTLPDRAIRTSGCSGGVTFDDLTAQRAPLPPGPTVSAQQIIDRYADLRAAEVLYPISRGVHSSALCTPDTLLLTAEDVGRHNTLDKLWGMAMQQGIDPSGCLILTTGRISAEMLGKAAKMGVPVIASRTSPTSRSLALAEAWNITIIGYIRRDSLRLYTGAERVEKK